MEIFPGIEVNSDKLGGKPCIKGKRFPVWMILEWLEDGHSFDEILEAHSVLTRKDIITAIQYVKALVKRKGAILNEVST